MAGIWKSLGPISDEKKLWSLTVRASLVVQKLIIADPGLSVRARHCDSLVANATKN